MSKLPPRATLLRLRQRHPVHVIANMFRTSVRAVVASITQVPEDYLRERFADQVVPRSLVRPLKEREIRDFYPEWGIKQGYVE